MDGLLTPEMLILVAGGTFVLGYLTINQVALRILLLIGTVFYIWYYAIVAEAPLWEAIYSSLVMGAANLIGLLGLLAQRSHLVVPQRHRDIYPLFSNLTPGDFRALVKRASRFTTIEDYHMATEGDETRHLFYIIDGSARVEKLGARFALPRCLVPACGGLLICDHQKDALWDKFFTGAPRPRTPSELSYSDRKLRTRR